MVGEWVSACWVGVGLISSWLWGCLVFGLLPVAFTGGWLVAGWFKKQTAIFEAKCRTI